jgi:Rrf2 family protein
MKLSTRSRYGTRMMIDLAEHYDQGPERIADISKRQGISVKYLEQLIIPMKQANLIRSIRGPKGGHMLAKPPDEITIGEIVNSLEGGINLTGCIQNPHICDRSKGCPTREIWCMATDAIYGKLNQLKLSDIITNRKGIT